jgi:hypothetical protein
MMRARFALFTACALTLCTAPARAFSDPLSFGDGVELGGGGGRYFTASVADGYGCDVCHRGAARPTVEIIGLPLAGYRPNTAYELRVEWPASLEHLGLALEITDGAGVAAGTLRLPPESELPIEERCEPGTDGVPATTLTEVGARRIVQVPDCGARRARFLWTTDAGLRGVVRLSGGLVASDGEADFEGDGVTMFAHAVAPARAELASASDLRGTRSASPGHRRAPLPPTLLLCAAALLLARRRKHS